MNIDLGEYLKRLSIQKISYLLLKRPTFPWSLVWSQHNLLGYAGSICSSFVLLIRIHLHHETFYKKNTSPSEYQIATKILREIIYFHKLFCAIMSIVHDESIL